MTRALVDSFPPARETHVAPGRERADRGPAPRARAVTCRSRRSSSTTRPATTCCPRCWLLSQRGLRSSPTRTPDLRAARRGGRTSPAYRHSNLPPIRSSSSRTTYSMPGLRKRSPWSSEDTQPSLSSCSSQTSGCTEEGSSPGALMTAVRRSDAAEQVRPVRRCCVAGNAVESILACAACGVDRTADDGILGGWMASTRTEILATMPSLFEHPDRERSLIGKHSMAGRNPARCAAAGWVRSSRPSPFSGNPAAPRRTEPNSPNLAQSCPTPGNLA